MFIKTGALKNFTNLTGKHCCWSLFLRKLQATLLKRDSNAGVFLRNLRMFYKHLISQITSGGCLCFLEPFASLIFCSQILKSTSIFNEIFVVIYSKFV